MMGSPDRWPLWPRLPVKQRGSRGPDGFPNMGLIWEDNLQPFKIYTGAWQNHPTGPFIEYENAAAAVDDGWVVD